MSNTILNIRFGCHHLQIVRFRDWRGEIRMRRSPITWSRNPYHAPGGEGREDPLWRWFVWY